MEKNKNLKRHAAANGVRLWEIADHVGISEVTLSRWMRHELPEERYKAMMRAIDEIAAGKEKENVR